MTITELIENLAIKNTQLPLSLVDHCVKEILEKMASSLSEGQRIEVRGFGSFSLHYRQPRLGRNPKTGKSVKLVSRYVPHFKAGKELKELVDIR